LQAKGAVSYQPFCWDCGPIRGWSTPFMGRPKRATDGSHGYIGFSDQACSSWPSEIPRSQKAYTVELRHSWIQHSRFIKCDLLRHSRFVYSWFLFFNTSRTGLPYPQLPILIQPENCSTEIKILCPETLPVSTHTPPVRPN